jgi:tol-pal system protein YbgF
MGVMRTGALALLVAAAPGCFWATTKHEGEVMQEQIKNLDTRLKGQEDVLGGRVKQLDDSIDKATKILARNNADMGARVDGFSDDIAKFAGKLDTLQRTVDAARTELAQVRQDQQSLATRMDNIERQLGIQPAQPGQTGQPVQPATLPANVDKKVLFDGAYQKLQAGNFDDARKEFRLYVQAFPQDDKADDAAFYVGESFFRQKDFEKAIAEYQRVIDTWPKGDMVDDAFLQAGLAAIEKGWCVDAGAYLGELLRRYPTSPLAKTARTKLEYVKKNAKNTKVCKAT